MAYKYNVNEVERKIECLSSFAKKPVSGIAKCDPDDAFNVETGKKLAKLRCDYKVSKKRRKKALENYQKALADFEAARDRLSHASEYVVDSFIEAEQAKRDLTTFELFLK